MSGIFSNIAAKIAANKFSRAITGWGLWLLSSWLYDDIFYPAIIAWLGVFAGGLIAASIAIAICWIWLKLTLASDKEWFNMKILRKIQRIIYWAARVAKYFHVKASWVDKAEYAVTFLLLSFKFDPIITTLYFRYEDKTKVITRRDKKIFWWSAILSNAYWILISWGLVKFLKFAWKTIQASL
jgi:hypothetical protein